MRERAARDLMGDKSLIEWTDATWNPVTGCTKVSPGCKHCYAERLAPKVFAGQVIRGANSYGPTARQREFTDVLTHPGRLEQPLHWKKPRRIFVNSMSDLFHEDVPDLFIDQIFETMIGSQHVYQILTKRPERMRAYLSVLEWPRAGTINKTPLANVWLGVSAEDQATADERIPLLLQTPAAVRFVSYEPALGPVDFDEWLDDSRLSGGNSAYRDSPASGIDWIIAGGESGPDARAAHPAWFRSVRDQCSAAGVPFFFKQWGEWGPDDGSEGVPGLDRALRASQRGTFNADGEEVYRFGKKAAGRQLDGRTHDEYPA